MRMNPQDATTRNPRKFYVNDWVKFRFVDATYIGKIQRPIPTNPTNPTSYFQVQLLFPLEVATERGRVQRRRLTRLSSQQVEMYKTEIENAKYWNVDENEKDLPPQHRAKARRRILKRRGASGWTKYTAGRSSTPQLWSSYSSI